MDSLNFLKEQNIPDLKCDQRYILKSGIDWFKKHEF